MIRETREKECLVVYVAEKSRAMAELLCRELGSGMPVRYETGFPARWAERPCDLVFIGALGICVRAIAQAVGSKYDDPAVTCVDSGGRHAIAVLSGHVGGANELTRRVARILGASPVITTQSDGEGLWALDTLARQFGWQQAWSGPMNGIIAHYVNGRPTRFQAEVRVRGVEELERTRAAHVGERGELTIRVTYHPLRGEGMELNYYPPVLHLGIGCARNCPPADIPQRIADLMHRHGLSELALSTIDTIEQKQDEPLLKALAERFPWARTVVHRAEDLRDIPVPHPSAYALEYVGTPSVCEAAALTYGPLLMEKQKGENFTAAVSINSEALPGGHVEIVGAGPGDPELISLRGRRFLQRADLILYAGSLVPEELTHCAKAGATVRSSATMSIEEQFDLMKSFYDSGKLIVRLHTGDPCIYGAIQEQMALFDANGMSYHITPGISAFQAAAAALRSQFTIPGKVQTIILTRGEGRTPMPEREQLHRLAQSRSTMCIYLSAAIAGEVQAELLQAYPPETPVAVCYKLSWPEERIWRGRLDNLAKMVSENGLTLTTLLVVGEAVGNRSGRSCLYDKSFSHLFRP